MKILLIAPATGKWRHVGRRRVFNGKTFRFSLLSLLSVASETPEGNQIDIVDEQTDDIPWDAEVDLVGITCMTAAAPRAFEIGDRFRRRGVLVVMGGMHPTFCTEETLRHADAVVAGEAEGVWSTVVEDAQTGRCRGVYRSSQVADLSKLKPPPRTLLASWKYSTRNAVQATRGCPHACSFCSVSAFNGGRQRQRPVDDVVREVAGLPSRFFMFIDDNLTADREYAKTLFQALAPLRKLWISQSTLEVADDPGLVGLAAEAGCIGLFVGLETLNESNLDAVKKSFNRADQYRESVRLLHAHGIGVEAGVVFGFERDRTRVFSHTLSMLDDLEIDAIQVSAFTPLPGTPQYENMISRILDRDWAHYDFHHVVFEPKGMSAEDLQAGHDWVTHEFYRPWRIARRMARWVRRPRGWESLPYAAAINAAYFGRSRRWGIRGWNPVERSASPDTAVKNPVASTGPLSAASP